MVEELAINLGFPLKTNHDSNETFIQMYRNMKLTHDVFGFTLVSHGVDKMNQLLMLQMTDHDTGLMELIDENLKSKNSLVIIDRMA